jgi:hypothetical protein
MVVEDLIAYKELQVVPPKERKTSGAPSHPWILTKIPHKGIKKGTKL